MIDIITYIPDLLAFRAEANTNAANGVHGFAVDEDGVITYNIAKIPVHYNGLKSLCLVRLMSKEDIDVFDALVSCERIGVCEDGAYVFDDGGEAIYNEVYDQTPTEDYTPPQMIGVFA